jgi:hypothetical protein
VIPEFVVIEFLKSTSSSNLLTVNFWNRVKQTVWRPFMKITVVCHDPVELTEGQLRFLVRIFPAYTIPASPGIAGVYIRMDHAEEGLQTKIITGLVSAWEEHSEWRTAVLSEMVMTWNALRANSDDVLVHVFLRWLQSVVKPHSRCRVSISFIEVNRDCPQNWSQTVRYWNVTPELGANEVHKF